MLNRMIPEDLTFSDSAKYAEAAKSLIEGNGLRIHHSFFDPNAFQVDPNIGFTAGFPPLPSYVMAFFFKFLPASDSSVILLGSLFFCVLIMLVFFIGRRYYGALTGSLAVFFLLLDHWWWEYAFNFSSEILFAIELLLSLYFILRKDKFRLLAFITLLAAFFTRQQSSLLLVSLVLSVVLLSFLRDGFKKSLKLLLVGAVGIWIIFAVSKLDVSRKYSPLNAIYSTFMRTDISPGMYLRGELMTTGNLRSLGTKTFYNLYNFLKSPDRLSNYILWLGLFLFAFSRHTNSQDNERKTVGIVTLAVFIFGASMSLPNARYVHPVFPFLAILSSWGYVDTSRHLVANKKSFGLIFFLLFLTIPYIGKVTFDQRFNRHYFNFDKPRVTKVIADRASHYIPKNKIVVTNMDAWLAWYHGITTIWFPKEMELINPHLDKIDYVFITDYQSNDSDFALNNWSRLLGDENFYFENKFKVIERGEIKDSESFEKITVKFVILSKND